MKEKRNHFLTAIITILFLIVSCETGNYSTTATPTNKTNEEQQPNENNEDVYIVYSGYNYLWEHEYVYNADKLLDLGYSNLSQFYGTWESATEKFIFESYDNYHGEFKYFEHKNNKKPKYAGKFITYNNNTDLGCDNNLGGAMQMVIFTPFKFENDKLYLGRNKYRLFNLTEKKIIEEQQPNENNNSNEEQPPNEINNENNNSANENNNPQIEQPQIENYLYPANNPNINNLISITAPFNQGVWENENGEVFEFYNGWYFKYWQNGELTYTGNLILYRVAHNDYENFYFVGKVNGEIVIYTKITIDTNETGIIYIGGEKFNKLYNYLIPDKNININNYASMIVNDVEFDGIWENKNGEMFQFISRKTFKYWDSSNKDGERAYMSVLYKAPPTFEGDIKTYQKELYYFSGVVNNNIEIFTPYEFKIVDMNINGYWKELLLNGIQYVKRVRTTQPIFN